MEITTYGCIYCGEIIKAEEIIVYDNMTQCPECYRDDAFRVSFVTEGGEEE